MPMNKSEHVKLRLSSEEKEAFKMAAEISGLSLSASIRERHRRAARIELVDAGREVPFIQRRTLE